MLSWANCSMWVSISISCVDHGHVFRGQRQSHWQGSVRDLMAWCCFDSVWINQRLPGWWPDTARPGMSKDRAKSGRTRKTAQQTDNIISGMAAIPFLQQMGPTRCTNMIMPGHILLVSSQIISSKIMWTCLSGQCVSIVKHNQQQNVYEGKYGVYYITTCNYNTTPWLQFDQWTC